MPSFFSRKKSSNTNTDSTQSPFETSAPLDTTGSAHWSASPPASSSAPSSPDKDSGRQEREKKSKGYFLREREKDRRPKSPRSSKSFSRARRESDSHPLNLPPDELRRLSALSAAMSSSPQGSRDGGVPINSDRMETTPAPETPGSFPTTNGVNGDHEEQRPTPPPHRTPATPPPETKSEKPQIREEEAEAFKAAGNKLYKAGQYGSAVDEYTKGRNKFLCTLRVPGLTQVNLQPSRRIHNLQHTSPIELRPTWLLTDSTRLWRTAREQMSWSQKTPRSCTD